MWTQRFGVGLDETTVSNLILIDEDVNIIKGVGMPNPANRFHSYIYRARPDVMCIAHTHPPHVSALSMLNEELVISHMDTMTLYEDCAFLPEWPGVPVGDEEGVIISEALKDKHAIMLAHHGQLVACADVPAAAMLAVTIERAAKIQMLARAVGAIKPVNPEIARDAYKMMTKPKMFRAIFEYYARGVVARHPECLS